MSVTGKIRGANQFIVTNRRIQPVQEGTVMMIQMEVARVMWDERQKNMIRKAEQARIAAEMPINGVSRIAAARRQVGAAMVRAGERMQGAQRPEVAAELPYGATLRTAR